MAISSKMHPSVELPNCSEDAHRMTRCDNGRWSNVDPCGLSTTKETVTIVFASETGTAEAVAGELDALLSTQVTCELCCVSTVSLDALQAFASAGSIVLFIVSTAGDGEPPRTLRDLWKSLLRASLACTLLVGLRTAILGLGDSSYARYNAAARRLRARLSDLGATTFAPSHLADDASAEGIDVTIDAFADSVATALGLSPAVLAKARTTKLTPRTRLQLFDSTISRKQPCDMWESGETKDWVNARVVVNEILTNPAHLTDDREVRRVVFDVNNAPQSSLLRTPRPGDVLELRPRNAASAVDAFLKLTDLDGAKRVCVVSGEASWLPVQLPCRLDVLISSVPDLGARVRTRFLARLAPYASDERERARLQELSSPQGIDDFYTYAIADMRTPLMVLRDFPTARPPLDALLDMLPVLRPRAFSIARSTGCTVEICASMARWTTPLRFARVGVASAMLCRAQNGSIVPIRAYMGPRPNIDVRVVLIAAGAGAAFVRPIAHAGVAPRLLFFGCRHPKADMLYADEWQQLVEQRRLTLVTAFSRATKDKVYVQHRILEHAATVWEWISSGAHIYVSGRAGAFARCVREALVDVAQTVGNLDEVHAERFIRTLEKRRCLVFECW